MCLLVVFLNACVGLMHNEAGVVGEAIEKLELDELRSFAMKPPHSTSSLVCIG
jgi:hypothetical protein